MWSVECGVWRMDFGVWSVECGVWSVEFGVLSVEPGGRVIVGNRAKCPSIYQRLDTSVCAGTEREKRSKKV